MIDTSESPKAKRLFHILNPGERLTINVHISPGQVSDCMLLWSKDGLVVSISFFLLFLLFFLFETGSHCEVQADLELNT